MNKKETIIDALREISILESNVFKSRAYLNAVTVLTTMSEEEFQSRKSFMNIQGIGMSINTKIMDYKLKGELPAKLFKLREENKSYLDPQLYKIRKGFVSKRVPFSMAKYFVYLVNKLASENGIDSEKELHFLGSYRRNKSLIADLDMLVCGEEMYLTMSALLKEAYFVDSVTVEGPMKTTFLLNNVDKTTLDLTWCDKACLPFSILHFTGSAAHNVKMRAKAKSMGYTLNQYGLYPNEEGKTIDVKFESEKDIYDFLGMDYIEPENR